MVTVRRAVAGDVPWLLVQCRAFAEFFGSTRSLFPDDLTAVEKLTALMNEAVGCFFVAEKRGHAPLGMTRPHTPLGFIAGILTPHFFNPSIRVLNELLWWVSPEHRGSRAGALLLREYERYGESNADWITMTLEAESPVNPAALTKRGFRLYESSYLKEICEPNVSITDVPAGSDTAPSFPAWAAEMTKDARSCELVGDPEDMG